MSPGLRAGGDASWGKLLKGAQVVRTTDVPPLITKAQFEVLARKQEHYMELGRKGGNAAKGKAKAKGAPAASEDEDLIEVDEPLPTHADGAIDEVSMHIGHRIADRVMDESTLQLGIGAVPDAVLAALTHRKGLRIWTEMFSDGVLELSRKGALDADIPITASFVFGSSELYEWLNLNRQVRMLRTEKTNDPGQIARQARMTSINSALQIDLFDQANASYVRGQVYSGFGGSTDFIVGALHARGGASFMALQSWHPKANSSTIVPRLSEPATSFQHSYVVTEQGVADCFGHSALDQARNLIEKAAHPSAREQLRAEAAAMGLLE